MRKGITILMISLVTGVCMASDTGTVVFQYGGGAATGCFKDIIDVSDITGDSTYSSIYFPYGTNHEIPEIMGIGCNEDTGASYKIQSFFYSRGFQEMLERLCSSGYMLDTAGLSVTISGRPFHGFDWNLEGFAPLYLDKSTPAFFRFRTYFRPCSLAAGLAVGVDSSSGDKRYEFDLTPLYVQAAIENRLDWRWPQTIGFSLQNDCKASAYEEYGLAVVADESSDTMENRPAFRVHCRIERKYPCSCILPEQDTITLVSGIYDVQGFNFSEGKVYNIHDDKPDSGDWAEMDIVLSMFNKIYTLDTSGLFHQPLGLEHRLMDLGDTCFNQVLQAPAQGYGDSVVVGDWRREEDITDHSLIIQTRGRKYAKMFMTYVNPSEDTEACVISFIYEYQPDGSRDFIDVDVENKRMDSKKSDEMLIYANPFNPFTNIAYNLGPGRQGVLRIFDIRGRMVLNRSIQGSGSVRWDAAGLGNGVYILKAVLDGERYGRKLILKQ